MERQKNTLRSQNNVQETDRDLTMTEKKKKLVRGKTLDSDRAKSGLLTLTISRATLPLIYHDSHTLALISADRGPY